MITFSENYFLLALFIFTWLLMLALGALFSFMAYSVWTDGSNLILKITSPMLASLLILGLIKTPKIFSKRYYSVTLDKDNKNFIVRYPFRNEEIKVLFKDIKGFSKSTDNNYYGGAWNPKKDCITLYLINDDKIDLTQYQFSGFKKFRELFENQNFHFLGEEPFIIDFKNGRRRMYKY